MKKTFLLKTMLLLCALVVGSMSAWADDVTWTHEFASPEAISNNAITVGGAAWSVSTTTGAGSPTISTGTYSQQYGLKFGSSKSIYFGSVTFSTNYFNNYNVKSVSVKILNNGKKTGTLTASQGNTTIGSTSLEFATEWKDLTVNTASGLGGTLSFTYSVEQAFYIHSITVVYTTSGGGGSNPSISLSTYSVNATTAATEGTINVTYNNIDSPDAEVLFYESDGTTSASYDWITAQINSSNNVAYSINANTGAARAAYMKVHQKNTDIYSTKISINQEAVVVEAPTFSLEPASNTYYLEGMGITLTSAAGNTIRYTMTTDGSTPSTSIANSTLYTTPIPLSDGKNKIRAIAIDEYGNTSSPVTKTYDAKAPAALPFVWEGGGKSDFTALTGIVGYGLGSDYAANNAPYLIKFDDSNDYIEIFTNAKPLKVNIGVKMLGGGSTSKITVQESTNGVSFTNVQELTISGSSNDIVDLETTEDFAPTTRVIKLLFTKGSNVGVGPITISTNNVTIAVSAAGLATFVCDAALDYSDVTGLEAYIAKEETQGGNTVIALQKVNKVPAGTGVLLRATAGGTSFNVPVTTATTDNVTGNKFVRGTGAAVASDESGDAGTGPYNYILNIINNQIGFYKANGQTVAKNRAYLHTTIAAESRIAIDIDPSGINVISRETTTDNRYYDLQGRPVAQPTKGLYIVNGKKVIIK